MKRHSSFRILVALAALTPLVALARDSTVADEPDPYRAQSIQGRTSGDSQVQDIPHGANVPPGAVPPGAQGPMREEFNPQATEVLQGNQRFWEERHLFPPAVQGAPSVTP